MKLINKIKNLNDFKKDPLGFIIDTIIIIVVNLLIPIPLSGNIVAKFRGPVLGCLASVLILGIFILTTVGTILMSPFLFTSGFLKTITLASNVSADNSFAETSVPRQNPFGGAGLDYSYVTSYFMDASYFLSFGKSHTGIDMVPSDIYFKNSSQYKESGKIVIFSTMDGKVNYYIDGSGGETVEITNDDNTIKTIYIHFSQVLVNTGDTIKAGTPIGIMGSTGFSTGDHVHYEIRMKDGSSWLAVNPLNYIQ